MMRVVRNLAVMILCHNLQALLKKAECIVIGAWRKTLTRTFDYCWHVKEEHSTESAA